MPTLSVRAFAELLDLPAYEQVRVLSAQKHPTQEPQVFRIPFYAPSVRGIRSYYRDGNDPAALARPRTEVANLGLETRRNHNRRVLDQFANGPQARRRIVPVANPPHTAGIGQVELRLQFDVLGTENETRHYILYNFRAQPIDPAIARLAIEIAHWVLEQNEIRVALQALEVIDLTTERTHRTNRRRATTIHRLRANARIIETLWPTI